MNYGFIKTAASSLKLKVADVTFNTSIIKKAIDSALEKKVKLLVTPELSVTGYTCADLFFARTLLIESERAVAELADYIKGKDVVLLVGAPVPFFNKLYNCAVVIDKDGVKGIVPKKHLANYNEFYEKRWFASGFDFKEVQSISYAGFDTQIGDIVFDLGTGAILGVELCEDLWVPNAPSTALCLAGANVIANLSASNEAVTKDAYRKNLIAMQSAKAFCAYVYASAGVGESTTDLVFSGACTIAENGALLAEGERFAFDGSRAAADIDLDRLASERRRDGSFGDCAAHAPVLPTVCARVPLPSTPPEFVERVFPKYPFVPADEREKDARCREILSIQSHALAKRMAHTGAKCAVVGISGGLDSTLTLLVCARSLQILGLPAERLLCVTMPGFGTTDRTYNNACALVQAFGAQLLEIPIREAAMQHMRDIGHDPAVRDVTYENTQARERTQILMDLANKHGGLLVGTGDLSELALGWCTYNADHMSMYGVNCGVPKTLVRHLVENEAEHLPAHAAAILRDILETPVSPELLPPDEQGNIQQKTEETLGPYAVHDFFLYHFLRFGTRPQKLLFLATRTFREYTPEQLEAWLRLFLRRFFSNQFKRSCLPDGPKVGSVSLSPRGDWRMPSDADCAEWLDF